LEVLRELKTNPDTQQIPIVMLTSSTRKADLEASYKAGANSYLVKSLDFARFTQEVRQMGEYWLSLNRPME
jgi:CheY-like chemotaxis protein